MSDRKNLLIVIVCAAVIGLATFSGALLQNGGFFSLASDFNDQQIPFSAAMWEGIHAGSSWIWGLDLGASLITGFSFYGLGSPFFWITLLFPRGSFPWLAGFLFILKYITAAGTGYAYLRRFSTGKSAVLGGLIYAFSGFQATNMIFHFQDAVAFFPLLLIGLEDYLKDQKKAGFIFAVFLNCLTNYFFFLQETIFLILYFLFRIWKQQSLKQGARSTLGCLLCGIWGVGMAGILFIPSVLYTLESSRNNVEITDFFFAADDFLHVIKSILLPGDTMDGLTSIMKYNYGSASCYLPLFGITLSLAYVFRKRDWLGRLLIFLFVLALFPLGNAMFLLLRGVYYRWWYMWLMMMALATVQVLDHPSEYPIRISAFLHLGLIVLLYLLIQRLALNPEDDILVYDGYRHNTFFLLAGAGVVLSLFLVPMRWKHRNGLLLILTCVFCAGTTAMTLYTYREHTDSHEEIRFMYLEALQLKQPDDQYRFDSSENLLMVTGNAGGFGSFVTTAENESFRFNQLMGIYDESNLGDPRSEYPGIPELLGAKYIITSKPGLEKVVDSITVAGKERYIIEQDACPIGFSVQQWIQEEDLADLTESQRAVVLMNAMTAEGKTREMVIDQNMSQMPAASFGALDMEESIHRTMENAVENFRRSGSGFSCSTSWDQDRIIYFTVPYDTGWAATVDGESAEIYNSSGMIAFPAPAGKHEIVFTYHTPGFALGAVITALSFLLFFLYVFLSWKRR